MKNVVCGGDCRCVFSIVVVEKVRSGGERCGETMVAKPLDEVVVKLLEVLCFCGEELEGEGILRRRNTSFVVGSAVVPGCGKGPNGSCAEKCRCHRGGLRACCEPNAKMLLPCLQGLRV